MARNDFVAVVDTLSRELDSVQDVAQTLLQLFPVSGAAVSTLGRFLGNETLSATSDLALRVDEAQFDIGEGPCWDALSSLAPVHEPNLPDNGAGRWPVFSTIADISELGAIYAFPMMVGPLRIGAVDMYSSEPASLAPLHSRQASALAGLIAKNVVRLALAGVAAPDDVVESKYSRRRVHQATGMVLSQLRLTPDDAYLVIQGHAFATSRTVMEVANDIIGGELVFSPASTSVGDES